MDDGKLPPPATAPAVPSSPKVPAAAPAAKAPAPTPPPSVKGAVRASRESVWDLRKPVPRNLRLGLALSLPVVLLVLWCVLTMGSKPIVGPLFLPSPGAVLRAFAELFFRDQCDASGCAILHSYLLRSVWASTVRIFFSFLLAAAIALPLGIFMGSWEPINAVFEPVMAPLRYLPISAFIPLLILWLGIGEAQKVAFLFLGVFVFLLPVVVTAIRAVPEELVQTALTLGATRFQVIRTVLLPAALPDIFDSFRVMNAISWTYVILAEFVNAQVGLGYMIDLSGKHLKTAEVFAGIVIIGIIGLGTDWIIRGINRALFPWREELAGS